MRQPLLKISDLHAGLADKKILKGLDLTVYPGEVHAIMGPNGSGKSTLSKVVAGHPGYSITQGSIEYEINFNLKDLTALDPAERAKEGVFLAYQYPVEVPGVSNELFLRTALNSVLKHQGSAELTEEKFRELLTKKMASVEMAPAFLERGVNVGFSGGEKKRNEILQLAVLAPRLAFLDETDSGLDIDALKIVANGVNQYRSKNNAIVLVTHYQRLLDYIKPDFVHVLAGGKIVKSGGPELALTLEKSGYDGLINT